MQKKIFNTIENLIVLVLDQMEKNLVPDQLTGHNHFVNNIVFSPTGNKFISGTFFAKDPEHNNLFVWNTKTHKILFKLIIDPEYISSFAFSPDGYKIVTTSRRSKHNLTVWNAESGHLIWNFIQNQSASSALFTANSKQIISEDFNSKNSYVTVWDIQTGKELLNLGFEDTVNRIQPKTYISPNGSLLIIYYNYKNPHISIWDTEYGKKLVELENVSRDIQFIKFNHDSSKIIITPTDPLGKSSIWDVSSGKKILTLENSMGENGFPYFSPNGKIIASKSHNIYSEFILWDALSGKKLFNLIGHQRRILSVIFTQDSKYIISCSQDEENNIIVWNAFTGKMLLNLTQENFSPSTLKLSPDNTTLIVGGHDEKGMILVWHIPFDALTCIQNDLNEKQLQLLYNYYRAQAHTTDFIIEKNSPEQAIYETLPESVKELMKDKPEDNLLTKIEKNYIKFSNFLKVNSFFVLKQRFKRRMKRVKEYVMDYFHEYAKRLLKTKFFTFFRKKNNSYGSVKFLQYPSYSGYYYEKTSNMKMKILADFLTDGPEIAITFFTDAIMDDECLGTSSETILLDKEGDFVFLSECEPTELIPTELKMTRKEIVELLAEWIEKVLKVRPKEATIIHKNNTFYVETKN